MVGAQPAAAARPRRDGVGAVHRAGPRALGRAHRTRWSTPRPGRAACSPSTLTDGTSVDGGRGARRHRAQARTATCSTWTAAGLDPPRGRPDRGRRPAAHVRRRGSGRSATSARRSSSSTSPTTSRRSCGTTSLHPEDPRRTDHRFVPRAVFTHPQIASVGRTEEQCRTEGLDITVKIQAYGDVAYGWAMEDTTGFCKIIADRGTGQLLGAHVMGAQAASIIQPLIQAMSFGLGAQEMATGQYWIHPALPEVVENALLGPRPLELTRGCGQLVRWSAELSGAAPRVAPIGHPHLAPLVAGRRNLRRRAAPRAARRRSEPPPAGRLRARAAARVRRRPAPPARSRCS